MKVLFVSNDPSIFTADSAVRTRLRAYARFFDELHVVSPAHAAAEYVREGNMSLIPIFASRPMRLPVMAYVARAVIRARDIDVVSAQDPFEQGLAALIASVGTGARRHIQVHSDFLSPYFARESFLNRIRILIAALTLRTANGIRVVSERIRRFMLTRYGDGIAPPSVIPVAVSAGEHAAIPLPPNSYMFSFIAVSRLEPEKRIEDVLSALVLVCRKYPDAGLFIAGDGRSRRSLEARTEALGLSKNVVFLGWRTDASGLMKSAQAFVQASAHEGYALSLLEAALAGIPVATTDVGIAGDVLVSEESALISAVAAPEALAANMLRLIENRPLCEALASHARQSAEAHVARYADQPKLVADDIAATVKTASMTRP